MTFVLLVLSAALPVSAQNRTADSQFNYKKLNSQARSEYLLPVHRGNEERPYWNVHAKKFMYAPAFGFKKIDGAVSYEYVITQKDGKWTFKAETPNESLSKVWDKIPVGHTDLVCNALDRSGNVIGEAGKYSFLRDFPFNGPYVSLNRSYRETAIKGLLYIHNLDAVKHWKDSTEPDMDYLHNAYACKIIGHTVIAECMLSRLLPSVKDDAIAIARNAADFLIRVSEPEGSPLAFFPPTYCREPNDKDSYIHHVWEINQGKTMTFEPASVVEAFLDLSEVTNDKKYFNQALRIMDTYKKIQSEDGSFPIKLYVKTGEPVEDTKGTSSPLLLMVERLRKDYGIHDYDEMEKKARDWMDRNYLQSYNFTGQFEDQRTEGIKPYENLTHCLSDPYAYYLLVRENSTEEDVRAAEELLRFGEDQFVHWDVIPDETTGLTGEYAPGVHEQYKYEVPVDASIGEMGRAQLAMYNASGDKLWLAKAASLANSLVFVQDQSTGCIPTVWYFHPVDPSRKPNIWLNCTVISARFLLMISDILGG